MLGNLGSDAVKALLASAVDIGKWIGNNVGLLAWLIPLIVGSIYAFVTYALEAVTAFLATPLTIPRGDLLGIAAALTFATMALLLLAGRFARQVAHDLVEPQGAHKGLLQISGQQREEIEQRTKKLSDLRSELVATK
jgi:hypothetical protein